MKVSAALAHDDLTGAHELATEPEEEHAELKAIYETKGFPSHLAEEVATVIMQDPEVALQTHAREELGLDPDRIVNTWPADRLLAWANVGAGR